MEATKQAKEIREAFDSSIQALTDCISTQTETVKKLLDGIFEGKFLPLQKEYQEDIKLRNALAIETEQRRKEHREAIDQGDREKIEKALDDIAASVKKAESLEKKLLGYAPKLAKIKKEITEIRPVAHEFTALRQKLQETARDSWAHEIVKVPAFEGGISHSIESLAGELSRKKLGEVSEHL